MSGFSMETAFPISAFCDGTETTHSDTLYLLDRSGTVLSFRGNREMPACGTCFFKELSTTKAELEALTRTLTGGETKPYLMQCGPVPVLILCYVSCSVPYLLAAIPEGEVALALRTPAAYEGYLYNELKLSPRSLARSMPYDQVTCNLIRDWLHPYIRVFLREGLRCEEASVLMQILTARTHRLARLSGVRAAYDFSGIGFGSIEGIDYKLLATQLSAVMMLAARVAKNKEIVLLVERGACEAPVIYVRMIAEVGEDPLPELKYLREQAALHAAVFKWEFDAARKMLHIHFSFCTPEISVQELRNFFRFG